MVRAVDAATPVTPTKELKPVANARAALAAACRSCGLNCDVPDETTMNMVVSQSMQFGFQRPLKPSIPSFGLNGFPAHSKLGLVSAPLAEGDKLSQVHAASALERRGGRRLQGPRHGPRASVLPGTVRARPSGRTHERIQQVHRLRCQSGRCYIGVGHSRRAWRSQVFSIDDQTCILISSGSLESRPHDIKALAERGVLQYWWTEHKVRRTGDLVSCQPTLQ